jgi:D-glycero-D-manno-heptose 1,7-bisphosphate phosphatase
MKSYADDSKPSRLRKALFLDRDGVINIDYGYVYEISKFEFVVGIFDLARAACAAGYCLVVVTNQAGIGRGYYTEEQFEDASRWMCERFLREGAPIEKIYFSPYHPTEGLGVYRQDHPSRKPHPGMLFQAQKELGIDLRRSIMIGDKVGDVRAGIAAGIGTNLLYGPESSFKALPVGCTPISSLRDAIHWLA